MKKLFILLFAAGLVTAASAQSGDRYRSNNCNNSYQSSPYSNNQYNRNSQWNDRRGYNRYDRKRQRAEQMRYEMMMRRNRARYHNHGRYDSYDVPYRQPVFQLSIGIGGRR